MPKHVVVDGSNLATEGRPYPSLKQLNEAVLAYMEDNPNDIITVVVDATFGHRIDPSEVDEFDDAVDNNELVAPPAGAIGRGDAFVLTIAAKAGAVILSNDSFQEFHGEHPWLFDGDRLVGGKPVPNVGWVFVPRTPVRGPVSRRAQRDARHGRTTRAGELRKGPGRPSKLASEPLPVPKTPPPSSPPARRRAGAAAPAAGASLAGAREAGRTAPSGPAGTVAPEPARPLRPLPGRNEPINDLLPFLEFVERHPIGTPIAAEVDQFSSHGAYVDANGVRCYIPLRSMGNPAPKSARSVLSPGERREFVVTSYHPARRGVDVALREAVPADIEVRAEPDQPEALPAEVVAAAAEADRPKRTRRPRRGEPVPVPESEGGAEPAAEVEAEGGAQPAAEVEAAAEVEVELPLAPVSAVSEPVAEAEVGVEPPAPTHVRARRSSRRAEPAVEPAEAAPDLEPEPAPVKKRAPRKVAAKAAAPVVEPAPEEPVPVKKRAPRKRAAALASEPAAPPTDIAAEPGEPQPAKKRATKKQAAPVQAPAKKRAPRTAAKAAPTPDDPTPPRP